MEPAHGLSPVDFDAVHMSLATKRRGLPESHGAKQAVGNVDGPQVPRSIRGLPKVASRDVSMGGAQKNMIQRGLSFEATFFGDLEGNQKEASHFLGPHPMIQFHWSLKQGGPFAT